MAVTRYDIVFLQWLKHPARQSDRKNLIGDLICFFILMPLASVSSWLCIKSSLQFAHKLKPNWQSVGLITLSIFLVFTFSSWCAVSRSQRASQALNMPLKVSLRVALKVPLKVPLILSDWLSKYLSIRISKHLS